MEIELNLGFDATPERTYEAITTQKGLADRYTPRTKAQPKVGGLVEFGFAAEGVTLSFRVKELEYARHVAWSGTGVPPDWRKPRILFDIEPSEESVNLRFRQTGLPGQYKMAGCFTYLWGQYLRSLKMLLETGKGEPYGSPGALAAGTTPRQSAPPNPRRK